MIPPTIAVEKATQGKNPFYAYQFGSEEDCHLFK